MRQTPLNQQYTEWFLERERTWQTGTAIPGQALSRLMVLYSR